MDRHAYPLVQVTYLDVDFELKTNPDGTQTVNLRCGLLLDGQHADLINELAENRQRHNCPLCITELLHSAGLTSAPEDADSIACKLAHAEHQRHTEYQPPHPRDEAEPEQVPAALCTASAAWCTA